MDFEDYFTLSCNKNDFDRIEKYILSDEFNQYLADNTIELKDGVFIVQAVLDKIAKKRKELEAE